MREDRAVTGELINEPSLGSDPEAFLIYDGAGNFAAQFMKRDRSGVTNEVPQRAMSGRNNTHATSGYDAYFGNYIVDDNFGTVTQTLVGALAPENVGQVITRELEVEGDTLTIRLDTNTVEGQPVERTLIWSRAG